MHVRRMHLPDNEGVGADVNQGMLLLLLYHCPQVTTVLLFPMLTGKALLDSQRTQQKSLDLSSEPKIE
jgi:hypothetical protein